MSEGIASSLVCVKCEDEPKAAPDLAGTPYLDALSDALTRKVTEAEAKLAALREGITALAADLDGRCATRPPGQSHTEHEIAIALRKLLEA
jgi:hypothetical protein